MTKNDIDVASVHGKIRRLGEGARQIIHDKQPEKRKKSLERCVIAAQRAIPIEDKHKFTCGQRNWREGVLQNFTYRELQSHKKSKKGILGTVLLGNRIEQLD